ncbi:hypothetical protein Mapa_015756 [Marchantia paleacea]|nr:hypothetical protein Mapa_015756 [Marchantia paleacea]
MEPGTGLARDSSRADEATSESREECSPLEWTLRQRPRRAAFRPSRFWPEARIWTSPAFWPAPRFAIEYWAWRPRAPRAVFRVFFFSFFFCVPYVPCGALPFSSCVRGERRPRSCLVCGLCVFFFWGVCVFCPSSLALSSSSSCASTAVRRRREGRACSPVGFSRAFLPSGGF